MRLDSAYYRFVYRFGRPRWDSPSHRPELEGLVRNRRPGRALDIGCGTGSDARYLAAQGWNVVGVDFAPEAVESAKARGRADGSSATFLVADASRLREAGVEGPFDLVVDIGCYHAIPERRRDAYAAGVAAVAHTGADFYLAGIAEPPASWRLLGAHGVDAAELRRRFGAAFVLGGGRKVGGAGRAREFVVYHLVRS